jgi:hypothetical protein
MLYYCMPIQYHGWFKKWLNRTNVLVNTIALVDHTYYNIGDLNMWTGSFNKSSLNCNSIWIQIYICVFIPINSATTGGRYEKLSRTVRIYRYVFPSDTVFKAHCVQRQVHRLCISYNHWLPYWILQLSTAQVPR